MFTKEAVRTLRRLEAKNQAWFNEAEQWYEADRSFDCGEFGGGSLIEKSILSKEESLFKAVATAYGVAVDDLYDAVRLYDERQFDLWLKSQKKVSLSATRICAFCGSPVPTYHCVTCNP